MKRLFVFLLAGILFTNLYSQEKIALKPYWDNGLKLEDENKNFSIKLGGRIQYDVMYISQDDSLNNHFTAENGTEFRRARLYTSGTVYKTIKYKFQLDFAGNKVVIKDAYVKFTKIPVVGNITLGNFKEPRGFEMISSSNFITFMERSLTNQFDNDRSLGIMLNNGFFNKRFSVAIGYFYPSGNNAKYSGKEYNIALRIAGIPYYNDKDGFKMIHIGGGFTYENHDNQEASYSARPESHLAPKYLNLKVDESKNITESNLGLVVILNSFSFQSEYTHASIKTGSNSALLEDSYGLDSFYGNISWFITGEHKNYNKSKNAFDRLSPKKNLGVNKGAGAFELALRYSLLNLNDNDLQGGKMNNITLGLNWYLNPITRVTANYIHANIYELGISNIYQMRIQITF